MNQGWICLHRKFQSHPRYLDSEYVHVWIHLLLSATHRPMKAVWCGKEIELKPGQLITGRHSIAEKTGVSDSKVFRVLSVLKTEHQIEQQTGNQSSLITITNWRAYQLSEQQNGQQSNSQRTASEQPLNTNNNLISEKQNNTTKLPTKPTKLSQEQKRLATVFEAMLLGQWVNDAGKWIDRIKADPDKCDRVAYELCAADKDGLIRTTPAQFAEDIWKRFASHKPESREIQETFEPKTLV